MMINRVTEFAQFADAQNEGCRHEDTIFCLLSLSDRSIYF